MKTKVWAHRGASGYAPENTMEAFKMAIEMGADGIELDIQMSKDGKLVVIHDEYINRVSNGVGAVKEYTLEQLKAFNYNQPHQEFEYVTIPTLDEVYELVKDTTLIVNVELKNSIFNYEGMEEKALSLAAEYKLENRIIYSSFNHYSMLELKKLNDDAKTGFLYQDGILNLPQYAVDAGMDALHPPFYNLEHPDINLIRECKKLGIKLHVWTVNSKKDLERMYQLGIDAIITDYPDKAKEVGNSY